MLQNISGLLDSEISEVKRNDVRTLVSLFDKYKDVNPVVSSVVLFGSVATGDCNENSDIDIVVVGKDINKYMNKLAPMLTEFYHSADSTVDILYADSFEQMQETSRSHIVFLNVIEEGKIIWQGRGG